MVYFNGEVTILLSKLASDVSNNWFKSSNEWNSGRCMVIWERNLLTKYAKENKIFDSELRSEKLK